MALDLYIREREIDMTATPTQKKQRSIAIYSDQSRDSSTKSPRSHILHMNNMINQELSTKRKRNEPSYVVDDYFDERGINEQMDSAVEEDSYEGDLDTKPHKKQKRRPTSRPKKTKDEKPFKFLALPAELREEIYRLCLVAPDGASLVRYTKSRRRMVKRGEICDTDNYCYRRHYQHINSHPEEADKTPSQPFIPGILGVDKQIHSEAIGMLYRQKIIVEDTSTLLTFLASIGQSNRLLLEDLTVRGWGRGRTLTKGHNFAAGCLLATCTSLRSLFIDCQLKHYGYGETVADQLYRDFHYFFEAFGAAKGRKDAGVDIVHMGERNYENYVRRKARRNKFGHYVETLTEVDAGEAQFRANLRARLLR